MIPRRIFYCWFGGNPKPKMIKKCIHSWKHYCKNFEIIEINEDIFDIDSAPLYVQQAYRAKKWAFVSDYARIWAIVNYGGVYLDTDVELLKPINPLLQNKAYAFFETNHSLSTGFIGCEKDFSIFKEFLDKYNTLSFIKDGGNYDLTTNVARFTDYCNSIGVCDNNTLQNINGIEIYPTKYLFSKLPGRIDITYETYAIHYFSCTWMDEVNQIKQKEKMAYMKNGLKKEIKKRKIKNFVRKLLKN